MVRGGHVGGPAADTRPPAPPNPPPHTHLRPLGRGFGQHLLHGRPHRRLPLAHGVGAGHALPGARSSGNGRAWGGGGRAFWRARAVGEQMVRPGPSPPGQVGRWPPSLPAAPPRAAPPPQDAAAQTHPAQLTASGLGQPAWRWSAGTWPSSRAAATARAGCVGAGTGKQGGPPASPGPAAVLTAPPAQPQHPPTRIHPQSTPPHLSAERRPREPAARPPSGRCSADLGSHARRRPQGVAQAGQGGLGGGMGCLGC